MVSLANDILDVDSWEDENTAFQDQEDFNDDGDVGFDEAVFFMKRTTSINIYICRCQGLSLWQRSINTSSAEYKIRLA